MAQKGNHQVQPIVIGDGSIKQTDEIGGVIAKSIYNVLFGSYPEYNSANTPPTNPHQCFENGAFIFSDEGARLFYWLYYANKDPDRTWSGLRNTSNDGFTGPKKRQYPNPGETYRTSFRQTKTKYDIEKIDLPDFLKLTKIISDAANPFPTLTHLMPYLWKHSSAKRTKKVPNLGGRAAANAQTENGRKWAQLKRQFPDLQQVSIKFLNHPSYPTKWHSHDKWSNAILLSGPGGASPVSFNNVKQFEREISYNQQMPLDMLCGGKTTKKKGVIKFYHYQLLFQETPGAPVTHDFTFVKLESSAIRKNPDQHIEQNKLKSSATTSCDPPSKKKSEEDNNRPLMNDRNNNKFFEAVENVDDDPDSVCLKKGRSTFCYRAEDVWSPLECYRNKKDKQLNQGDTVSKTSDDEVYNKWKVSHNPRETALYKILRTGQEFYVSQEETNVVIEKIKEKVKELQKVTRFLRHPLAPGNAFVGGRRKRKKTRRRKKKKTRKRRKRRRKTRKR